MEQFVSSDFIEGGPVDVLADVAFQLAGKLPPCEAVKFPCPLSSTCKGSVPGCWKVLALCCSASSVITEK